MEERPIKERQTNKLETDYPGVNIPVIKDRQETETLRWTDRR